MRLVGFVEYNASMTRLGALISHDRVLEIGGGGVRDLLHYIELGMPRADEISEVIATTAIGQKKITVNGHTYTVFNRADVRQFVPFTPRSLRDFYAFEQHVKTANENRGRSVPSEWYQMPVFYYSNTSAILTDGDIIPYPSYSSALDYELEIACVIGKAGMNIAPEDAMRHIAGFMIFNDWSARDEQRREMSVGLGPAKGKDFASSLGALVTPDELVDRATDRPGVYDLTMIARVNGEERSHGNMRDLYYSFGQMIERASRDVMLRPGDVIGSGTVGTGCLLELTKGDGPWLQPGDVVELEIERLGVLRNTVGEKTM